MVLLKITDFFSSLHVSRCSQSYLLRGELWGFLGRFLLCRLSSVFFFFFPRFVLIYRTLKDRKYWIWWSFGLTSSGISHQERNGKIKEVWQRSTSGINGEYFRVNSSFNYSLEAAWGGKTAAAPACSSALCSWTWCCPRVPQPYFGWIWSLQEAAEAAVWLRRCLWDDEWAQFLALGGPVKISTARQRKAEEDFS